MCRGLLPHPCDIPCTALVDTGSTVTLVRPDVVPDWTQLEPTTVQLRTVTGGLAPMKGKGMLTLTVGGQAVHRQVCRIRAYRYWTF